jgi:hypothetical protein
MTTRSQIMYRQVGNTEIWIHRVSPSTLEVTVYDHIARTEKNTATPTLAKAYDVVATAISRELRRQQGDL